MEETGRQPSDQVTNKRKEIRRLISEIVHPTNLQVGHEKIEEIIRLGDELKRIDERR